MRPLCAIILNYGTPQLTIDCARSAIAQIENLGGELVIVDNASPDDSAQRIKEWRETLRPGAPVELIVSSENLGFAGGVNLGLRAREAECYVLLNSDAIVHEGALAAMLAGMRGAPETGVLGPIVTDETGAEQTSRFRNPSPLGEFVEASGLDIFYRLLRDRVVPIAPDEKAAPDWIGFSCVMLRKEMIDEIGLLDDGYFMYFEDADYCRRARAAGWKIAQCREAKVIHLHGRSSNIEADIRARRRLPAYYYASRARYFISWHGRAGFVAANILWHLGRAAGLARLLVLKRPPAVPAGRGRDIWITSAPSNTARQD